MIVRLHHFEGEVVLGFLLFLGWGLCGSCLKVNVWCDYATICVSWEGSLGFFKIWKSQFLSLWMLRILLWLWVIVLKSCNSSGEWSTL
jgi:hypothetical protein